LGTHDKYSRSANLISCIYGGMVKGLVPIPILFLLQVFEMTKFVKLAMFMETKKQEIVL
jgi:hypothetical protein